MNTNIKILPLSLLPHTNDLSLRKYKVDSCCHVANIRNLHIFDIILFKHFQHTANTWNCKIIFYSTNVSNNHCCYRRRKEKHMEILIKSPLLCLEMCVLFQKLFVFQVHWYTIMYFIGMISFYSTLLLALAQNLFLSCLLIYIWEISLDVERFMYDDGRGVGDVEKASTCLSNLRRHVLSKLEFLYCVQTY